MRNMELLAPAGDMESLKMAVYNGANAVYLGVKDFNARNNIKGFGLDDLAKAVDFAHLFDVKVYLALNILFKDSELQSALDVVVESNNIGVDAFIVQDLGLAYLIKQNYPSVELHASTQMAIHNLEGVKILEKLGFSRVVLARETSPAEIKRIHDNSDMDIEFFVHGALCVSFSGNCYMCSHMVGKSGNRGLCQQFCRLPYVFESGDVRQKGYLLSAKDICMIDNIKQMKDLGITSLKIEGRARRPFYVAQACKVYSKILKGEQPTKEDIDNLNIAFNRGSTPAYFNGNNNVISSIQGNNGLKIGSVDHVVSGKKFNEVYIKTNYPLGKCGLKFISNGKEIASIGAYDVKRNAGLYCVTTTSKIKVGSDVYIIQDDNLETEVAKHSSKLKVDIKIIAQEGKSIKCDITCGDHMVSVEGDECQLAKTIPTTTEQVYKQMCRSEFFEIDKFECELNNCYILNSTINKLRNLAYDKIKNKIINKYLKKPLNKVKINKLNTNNKNKLNLNIINNLNNLNCAENIIYNYNSFTENEFVKFDNYCKDNNIKGYIDLPNFATFNDIKLINEVLNKTDLGVVANNLYAFTFDCDMIGGQFLNAYNSYTIMVLNSLHQLKALFVEELRGDVLEDLSSEIPLLNREKVYMTLLHCPFKNNLKCECGDCKYVNNATFTLNSGKKFKISRKKTSSCVFLLKD